MKLGKRLLAFTFTLVLSVQTAIAQNNSSKDSLLFYLNSIHSKADSAVLPSVFDWIYKTPEDVLLKDDIMKQIHRLEGIVGDIDYFDLTNTYLVRLIIINTKESNEKAITIGNNFFEQYPKAKSRYGHYGYLLTFRDMRHAFRNLGKLNESIEYYAAIEKKYLAENDSDAVSIANNVLSGSYARLGISEKAYYHQIKSIAYLNESQPSLNIHSNTFMFGVAGKLNRYAVLSNYYLSDKRLTEADSCLREALKYYHKLDSPMAHSDVPYLFLQIALSKTLADAANSQAYYDTAFFYLQKYKSPSSFFATYYQEKGVDLSRLGLLDSSLFYLRKCRQMIDSLNLPVSTTSGQLTPDYYEAEVAIKMKNYPLAIKLLQNQLKKLENLNLRTNTIQAFLKLAEAYAASGKTNEAYQYMQQAFTLKENLLKDEKDARTLSFETERKMQENDIAIMLLNAKNESNRKMKYYFIGIISLLGLLAIALTLFYINKRKTSKDLSAKNSRLSNALEQLKSTQSQLIQSEKMASLGELTAGIAHEIQNPLNFVNNFSEVSKELTDEMIMEFLNGNANVALEVAEDLKQNLEKINHHGKRAADIVKGMLQHSRKGTGQKELTDMNSLADEYLRLSYHGLRAKDKSFNAAMKIDLDPMLPKINVVPQDIGRVLLNLINNAFYAVNEKKSQTNLGYDPTVIVSTKYFPLSFGEGRGEVKITVKDNGNGIPQKVLDKIFQPFFTTKPTGHGTGLGLSLSYDIVKAHGGEIKVNTKENEGTEFTITLPG